MGDGKDHRNFHLEGVEEDEFLLRTVPDRVHSGRIDAVWIGAHASLRVVARWEEVEGQ